MKTFEDNVITVDLCKCEEGTLLQVCSRFGSDEICWVRIDEGSLYAEVNPKFIWKNIPDEVQFVINYDDGYKLYEMPEHSDVRSVWRLLNLIRAELRRSNPGFCYLFDYDVKERIREFIELSVKEAA